MSDIQACAREIVNKEDDMVESKSENGLLFTLK